MKRVGSVLLILCVFLACAVPSSAAYEWHGQSFLDDYYAVSPTSEYLFSPDTEIPSLFSLDRVASRDSSTVQELRGIALLDALTISQPCYLGLDYTTPAISVPGAHVSSMNLVARFPDDGRVLTRYRLNSLSEYVWYFEGGVSTSDYSYDSDYTYRYFTWPYYYSGVSPAYVFSLDISSFPSFSSFEVSGFLRIVAYLGANFSDYSSSSSVSCSMYVNDRYVYSFSPTSSGVFDFAHYIYEGSEPVTSVSFSFVFSVNRVSFPVNHTVYDAGFSLPLYDSFSFSVLSGGGDVTVLDKFQQDNQAAQDSIGSYEEIENQWIDNMNNTFDALHIGDFSFDAGLFSAFLLLTGIFNDIWNILGIYNVLFVIPLLLGIGFLIVGRASRYIDASGGGSGGSVDFGVQHRGGTSEIRRSRWTGRRS